MIIEENFEINGISLVRHYSDRGVMIASDDGVEYPVAEDLASMCKVYHETDTPVESDAQEIVDILTGESE